MRMARNSTMCWSSHWLRFPHSPPSHVCHKYNVPPFEPWWSSHSCGTWVYLVTESDLVLAEATHAERRKWECVVCPLRHPPSPLPSHLYLEICIAFKRYIIIHREREREHFLLFPFASFDISSPFRSRVMWGGRDGGGLLLPVSVRHVEKEKLREIKRERRFFLKSEFCFPALPWSLGLPLSPFHFR